MYYDDKFRFKGGGQIHNLELAMARSGWNSDLVEELAKGENPALVRDLLLKKLNSAMDFGVTPWKRISDTMIIVNLNIPGRIPEGRVVEFSAFKDGLMVVDQREGNLYINGSRMDMYDIKRDYEEEKLLRTIQSIAFHRFLPIQLRDALIANPGLIPRNPNTHFSMNFLGTIYRKLVDGHLYCPSLFWLDRPWNDERGYGDLPIESHNWIGDVDVCYEMAMI